MSHIKKQINLVFKGEKELIDNICLNDIKFSNNINWSKYYVEDICDGFYFGNIDSVFVDNNDNIQCLIATGGNMKNIIKYYNLDNCKLYCEITVNKDTDIANIHPDKFYIKDESEFNKLKPLKYKPRGHNKNENDINIYTNSNILPDGFFACSSDVEPNRYNLRPIDRNNFEFCIWDFKIEGYNRFNQSFNEYDTGYKATIFRNGKKFTTMIGLKINNLAIKVLDYISKIQEHPLDLAEDGWDTKNIGRKIWWHEQPAIIAKISNDIITINPDYEDKSGFKEIPSHEKDPCVELEDKFSVTTRITDGDISWFRGDE